jgi:hypothetical protein
LKKFGVVMPNWVWGRPNLEPRDAKESALNVTLHLQIHRAPITDRSGLFRSNALLCERRAFGSSDPTSKQDWADLAMEWHTKAYLAAMMNNEIPLIDRAK